MSNADGKHIVVQGTERVQGVEPTSDVQEAQAKADELERKRKQLQEQKGGQDVGKPFEVKQNIYG